MKLLRWGTGVVLAAALCVACDAPDRDATDADATRDRNGADATRTIPPDDGPPRIGTELTDSSNVEAALDALRRYYEAIESRDYAAAYRLWGDEGAASGQTFEEFAAGFGETAAVDVEPLGPGRVEGAAGSQYVEIPVVVRARTTGGADQRFEGSYTMRRAMVSGATPAQRAWHIYSASLQEVD